MARDRWDYMMPSGRKPWPKHEAWKKLIVAMYDGEWTTAPQLQMKLKVKRSALVRILKGMVEAGIVETKMELSYERSKGRTKWLNAEDSETGKAVWKKRDGLLPRNYRSYRLLLDKITIEVENKKG